MLKSILRLILVSLLVNVYIYGQNSIEVADSLRVEYNIPEIGYAVISSDDIIELNTVGVKRINTDYRAGSNDRFHIGSCTKSITGFVAALLVKQGLIKWNTKIFVINVDGTNRTQLTNTAFNDGGPDWRP